MTDADRFADETGFGQAAPEPNAEPEAAAPAEPEPEPAAPAEAAPGEAAVAPETGGQADAGRRRFFRQLASEVFQATATVVGAANALQRSSLQAASAILDPTTTLNALAGVTAPGAGPSDPPTGFRTAFRVDGDRIVFVDQRELPDRLVEFQCETGAEVTWAIREMVVRGAPAIGQAAAYGLALTAGRALEVTPFMRRAMIRGTATALRGARPTAVNLRWAVDRMLARLDTIDDLATDGSEVARVLREEADAICYEATRDHGRLAEHGLSILPATPDRELRLLTHCNTGPLACGQFGTALGIVQAAVNAGRPVHVYVDETRPYLQGARLTAWELEQAGVPYTVIPDAAAGSLLGSGKIDAVLVGADRIAANGDTANKIGTYPLAVMAALHRVPFYVCAPISSVDLATARGSDIPIEERAEVEVTTIKGARITPPGARVWNPAFDVTPAGYISAIVTEMGVLRPPLPAALAAAVSEKKPAAVEAPALADSAS